MSILSCQRESAAWSDGAACKETPLEGSPVMSTSSLPALGTSFQQDSFNMEMFLLLFECPL